MYRLIQLVVISALTLLSSTGHAKVVTWKLENVTLEGDAGTVTGFFKFDADLPPNPDPFTNSLQLIDWNIKTNLRTFTPPDSTNSDNSKLSIGTGCSNWCELITLAFISPLSDAGGSVPLLLNGASYQYYSAGRGMAFHQQTWNILSGHVVAVPELSTLFLLVVGAGLMLVTLIQRSRRASSDLGSPRHEHEHRALPARLN